MGMAAAGRIRGGPAVNVNANRPRASLASRALNWVLVATIAASATVVVRDFAHYADRYPYLAVDDALANVSYGLATEGRYGFFASPNQAFTGISRHDGFFTYGPWYFYLGGGLIWLFGYSLTLLRAIHLIGILGIAATGFWWFGRERALVAGAILAVALLYCFDIVQWPMVRPDIAVSVFAVLFIIAAGRAIASESIGWWFLAGLGAGCAAWSHLIAWALVPAAVLTLAGGLAVEWRGPRAAVKPATALACGFAAATLMFYASFGFRVADHFASIRAYSLFLTDRGAADPPTALTVLGTHVSMAFSYLGPLTRALLASSMVAALALLALSWLGHAAPRRRVTALLLPPLAVLTGYLLSLAAYPNYHAGYALLSQVERLVDVRRRGCRTAHVGRRTAAGHRHVPATRVDHRARGAGDPAAHIARHGHPRSTLAQRWVGIQITPRRSSR